MQRNIWKGASVRTAMLGAALCSVVLLPCGVVRGQENISAQGKSLDQTANFSALTEMIGKLQAQVQDLQSALNTMRADQAGERSEIAALRRELQQQVAAQRAAAGSEARNTLESSSAANAADSSAPGAAAQGNSAYGDVLSSLREDLQLTNSKVTEQSQTKVESGSKYRLRLSGIVLLNLFATRGMVDNLDFPQFATPPQPLALDSPNAFGGTLRQSQIRLQTFGPDIAGAHTSADLKFDFGGGFPQAPNGATLGIARLRTGTVRFDWANTSVIAGQDFLFFAPLVPTSLASLAIPALSYSGNLWGWTPQVRVEHRVALSETSKITVQAGILDQLSGDTPQSEYGRTAAWGEESGQPGYAGRVSWSREVNGQELTIGTGGYYGRQSWGFGRNVNGWVTTADAQLPLGPQFEVSAEFFRGKAIGGLGGGIGQTTLWQGSFVNPATIIHGLDAIGGWAQLKYKPTAKFQINGALGVDSPFASELRKFGGNAYYEGLNFSRNLTPFVNFLYQPRSDVVFSTEYRRLNTTVLDNGKNVANQVNFSVGYLF